MIILQILFKGCIFMEYKIKVAGLERSLPICPVSDDLNIAAFIIFGDAELTCACASALLKKAPEYDYLITAESKGIPLAHEMARQHGDSRYMLARKSVKVYMRDVISSSVKSITTTNMQTLYLDGEAAEQLKGKRVLLVDDVVSTGESLRALELLVKRAGGEICGKMAILVEGDAAKRDDIIYLETLPLFDKHGRPISL